jgi:hypothetical protein
MRIFLFVLGILSLIGNFIMGLGEDREKAKKNVLLHAKLDNIDREIKTLVAQGRLSSEEADRLLRVNVSDKVTLQDGVETKVIRESK